MSDKKTRFLFSSAMALSAFLTFANISNVSANEVTTVEEPAVEVDARLTVVEEVAPTLPVKESEEPTIVDSKEVDSSTEFLEVINEVIGEAESSESAPLDEKTPVEMPIEAPVEETSEVEKASQETAQEVESGEETPQTQAAIVDATQAQTAAGDVEAFLKAPNNVKLRDPNIIDGQRISGQSRDHVSVEISKRGWESSDLVFIANGFKEADSLTGSALASSYNAPIIFTRDNVLPDVSKNEIKRLGASRALILGGENSVPNAIVQGIQALGLQTQRLNGANRYELAANIADQVLTKNPTTTHAFLVNGDAYADAISIAPVSAKMGAPILLTRSNALHKDVINFTPQVKTWTIIGGNISISDQVEKELIAKGGQVTERISGSNRYAVNRNILDKYNHTKEYITVASGERFADALTASVLSAQENSGILLVKNNNVGTINDQKAYIDQKGYGKTIFVGGPSTISDITFNALLRTRTNKPAPIVRNVKYRPNQGDTLAKVAQDFGTTAQAIATASGLSSIYVTLSPEQTLTIPQVLVETMSRIQSLDNRYTIYIDAGHGGSEPGAIYPGYTEKALNLNMAQKLNQRLTNLGYNVIMTRTSDQTVGLVERANAANKSITDIFISLHHNASSVSEPNFIGIETYYYRNDSEYKTNNNNTVHNNADRITNSAYLATLVQNQLIKDTGTYNRGVKSETFSVLRNTAMPAILVELGYGDNPYELMQITNSNYQNKMVNALTTAIDTYFKSLNW